MSNEPVNYLIEGKKKKGLARQRRRRNLFARFLLVLLKMILILIILILIGIIAAETYAFFYIKDVYANIPDEFNRLMTGMKANYSNSTVLDIDGNQLATLNGDEKRQIITLDEMSEYLPKAYIAIEDERFYEHHGIDAKRTSNAIYTYIRNDGSSSFGGSTITQQLVKNITNNKESTVERKVKEWVLAYELEKEVPKDKILEKYLNVIFVGADVYGVELGAQYYFNKSAQELSLAECAFLAGVTHSPNLYNPFEENANLETINIRTKVVLNKMLKLNLITQNEYILALHEVNEGLKFEEGNKVETVYSYHTDAAINQVIEDFAEKNGLSTGLAKSYIYSNGLIIYTTQNTEIQEIMEEEFDKDEYVLPSRTHEGTTTQAAMVVIDHKNGFVVGCVGGLGEKNVSRGLNRATQSPRQTGSAMKPLSVVAPALQEKIITAASIYSDSKTTFTLPNGEKYTPKNYNYYRGNITVRQALETSQNIPFIRIMETLTPVKSREYLEKMGITTLTNRDYGLSLAIGGLDQGITPLEMAGAYATIANNGEYIEPTFYTKVIDLEGNVVLEADQTKTKVLDPATAYVEKNLLTQPVVGKSGTATYCKIDGMEVSAKTGTTDNDYDRWLCGFTPYYTAACWFGYDYNETVKFSGNNPAGLIWSRIMTPIHADLESAEFEIPDGVVTKSVCRSTGKLAKSWCWKYDEIFSEDNLPEECSGHYRRSTTTEATTDSTEESTSSGESTTVDIQND